MRLVLLINFVIFLVIRILIKRNIFIQAIGYATIFFQTVVILSSPFRERGTSLSNISFEVFLFVFFCVCSSPVIIITGAKFLSEKKQEELNQLESKLNQFLYSLLFDLQKFVNKIKIYNFLEDYFAKALTSFVVKTLFSGKEILFLIFLGIPWLAFVIAFYFDLYNHFFYFSIYLLAFYFFISRIFSIILFIAKTTLWSEFSKLFLLFDKKLYFVFINSIDSWLLNRRFLANLIFDETLKTFNKKEDIVTSWKLLNQLLYFFIYFLIIETYWKNKLPQIKSFFYWLTFFAFSLGLSFYFSFVFGFFLIWILPFVIFQVYCLTFTIAMNNQLLDFLYHLDGFIGNFQQKLLAEKGFSNLEAYQSLKEDIPTSFPTWFFSKTSCLILIIFLLLIFLLILAFYFDPIFLSFFDNFSFLKFLHQVIDFFKITLF